MHSGPHRIHEGSVIPAHCSWCCQRNQAVQLPAGLLIPEQKHSQRVMCLRAERGGFIQMHNMITEEFAPGSGFLDPGSWFLARGKDSTHNPSAVCPLADRGPDAPLGGGFQKTSYIVFRLVMWFPSECLYSDWLVSSHSARQVWTRKERRNSDFIWFIKGAYCSYWLSDVQLNGKFSL